MYAFTRPGLDSSGTYGVNLAGWIGFSSAGLDMEAQASAPQHTSMSNHLTCHHIA